MTTPTSHQPEPPLIVFAGGGTGGHLYPALAVAQELQAVAPSVRIVFFASNRPIDETILAPTRYSTVSQQLPRPTLVPWRWPGLALALIGSIRDCRDRFRVDRPAVVVGTGGLASFFPVREAQRAAIPTALLNPDAIPGRANRILGCRADCVFAQWDDTKLHFGRTTRVLVTGCPTRPAFVAVAREVGLARFGLGIERKTLLITGASQGARNVNRAVLANLDVLRSADWQVLHLTGDADFDEVRGAYAGTGIPAVVLPFTHDMPEALAAADLVIARAGASFLAEITAVGRASILMPYPYHRDQHQLANAQCLARHGAASVVEDRRELTITAPLLRPTLSGLVNDAAARETMAAAAHRLGRRDAAHAVAIHILQMCAGGAWSKDGESLQALC